MIPLNYHHLYYFYVIAKAGTIIKACETLLLAQSTVSAQLKLFEAALGRRLFERKKQRLFLTEDGRLVLDYAESIFEMGQELQDAIRDKPLAGRVAIQVGILNAAPRAFGHALLECLLREAPTAHVTGTDCPQDEQGFMIWGQEHTWFRPSAWPSSWRATACCQASDLPSRCGTFI